MKRSMHHLVLLVVVALLLALMPASVLAQDAPNGPVGEPDIDATGVSWSTTSASAGFILVVSGPNGYRFEQNFGSNEQPTFQIVDAAGETLGDGLYKYELRPISYGLTKARASLNDGRDPAIARELAESQAQPIFNANVVSGVFTVQNGAIVDPNLEEELSPAAQSPATEGEPNAATAPSGIDAPSDQVILDDLIVDGSICVGLDCVNGESFGFDTLRLKENNLRIKAQDTSNSASFPSNDWQITFNESSNGGANKFSIDDIDGGRTPFTIEAGAPSHSLYVDDGGRIGLGTSTPVVEVHVVDGDTPTVRLEQDGSSGFTAQTWDLAGNETNFFVRDATNGSRLPLRIRPSAPSNSLFIDTDGDVGMGTASPAADLHVVGGTMLLDQTDGGTRDATLHVRRSDGTAQIRVEDTSENVAVRALLRLVNNGPTYIRFQDTRNTTETAWVGSNGNDLNIEKFDGSYTSLMAISSAGNVVIPGTITTGGSCSTPCRSKSTVEKADLLAKLTSVPVVEWSTTEVWNATHANDAITADVTHISPDTASFNQVYGYGKDGNSVAPLDVATVALAAAQALNEQAQAHSAQINSLQSQISALEAENAALQERLSAIEAALNLPTPDNDSSRSSIFVPSVKR